ncbi:hypothetical protein BSK59_33455, partial [Paenibacillus odorifer]|uniref:discoidin domain-containing protein n=1 Tax=Paenibacillus odorifer TaxID=189426 RepID=UPI000979DFC5
VSASSEYSGYPAWYAFDRASTSSWISANGQMTGWIQYAFTEQKDIVSYGITSREHAIARGDLKSWTLEGSNDGLVWNVVDERSNIEQWQSKEKRVFSLKKKESYRYYKINVTEIHQVGNAPYISIGDIGFYTDAQMNIRSLTGGVAFADANGNGATTDLGYGMLPTNNEWDKYISNFPPSKIQLGKTLDDVFHWNGAVTWSQDTPNIT